MSFALADKWIYRYTNNKGTLWMKVVCTHSKSNNNSFMPSLRNNGNSILLRFVNDVIGSSGQARDAIS